MAPISRRRLLSSTGIAVATTSIAGCTGDGGNGSGSNGSSDQSLEAQAREEGSMTFYSVIDESGMRNTILPPFQEQYDWMDFQLVSQGISEIASSMSTEYQTSNVESDAAINIKGTMSPLADAGVFRKPTPNGELIQFLEENYSDDLYTLPAVPGYLFPIQVIYHTDRVSDDEIPESYEDFANPALEGRIAIDDPTVLGSTGGQFATLRPIWGPDKWERVMTDISNNGVTIASSTSETARIVAQGGADVALSSQNSLLSIQDDGAPVEGLWLEPTTALNLPVYFAANSQNPKAAEFFAMWLLTNEGQRAIAETGRVPVNSEIATESGLIPSGVEVRPVAFNVESYYDESETWIERYEGIFG
jgi:iron(III) transport system substrate-binding protein